MVPGVLVKRVQPSYPGVAQAGQVDGDVAMNVTVAVDGTVQDIHVTHGLPQLIPAATHAVSQWRYSPARINGVAVPINTRIVIHFGFSADADEQNKLALKGVQFLPCSSSRSCLLRRRVFCASPKG
jgi:TonB family protein